MTNYSKFFSTLVTPQSQPAVTAQILNNTGGYVFKLEPQKQLERWLILGGSGGTYYATERKLTLDNARVIIECLDADPLATVETIASMSETGRAPKNDPAIFALAIAAGHKNPVARAAALKALPRVCRTGTHLFQFVESVQAMRGWGSGLKRAVAGWYDNKSLESVMYQVSKYGQRSGFSHRDLFRLARPNGGSEGDRSLVYRYIATGDTLQGKRLVKGKGRRKDREYENHGVLPAYLVAFEQLKRSRDPKEVCFLIREYNFTHEMVPSEVKNSINVWEALLEKMPPTALIRNMAKMTSVGLIAPLSKAAQQVAEKLTDQEQLKRAKVHPIQLLSALRVYASGHGDKGSLKWSPNQKVTEALNEAFYLSFGAIEPTGKATMCAVDVSGSMGGCTVAGIQGLTAREAAAAMAMVTVRTEKNYHVAGFSGGMRDLNLTPSMRLDDVLRITSNLPFDYTDCSLPMRWATEHNVGVEVFHVLTDNETNASGSPHAHQSLVQFRKKTGIKAKLAVLAFTASPCTIADPSDPLMLDVVGLDASVPHILSEFAKQ